MKTILFSVILFSYSLSAFAQNEKDEPDPVTQTQMTIDLGFTGLQFGAELKTGKTHTVQLRTGLLPLAYNQPDFNTGGNKLRFAISGSISAEYRYYYNFKTRLERSKDIRNNGANYMGFLVLFSSRPFVNKTGLVDATAVFLAGPTWGFNRALGDRFLFHLDLGPVYQSEIDNNNSNITLWADVRWCFRIK